MIETCKKEKKTQKKKDQSTKTDTIVINSQGRRIIML